ncbi:MAG: thiolase C-terminal domain-containing protein [Planctomycetaceae bacterium]
MVRHVALDDRRRAGLPGDRFGVGPVAAGRAAIADAGVEPRDIQAGVVGNFAAGLYTRQLHLGSLLIGIDDSLRGIPTLHTEAACASGSVAVLTAAQWIRGGLHDLVLVVGTEQQKTMSPAEGADVLAAAADWNDEKPRYGEHMMPKMFASIADAYAARHGLPERALATVVLKNYAHARRNPQAQMRDAVMTPEKALTACDTNPLFAPPLKITDCSQITDGAAAIVLASERFLRKSRSLRLLGFGHTTDALRLDAKDVLKSPIVRKAAEQAYAMAGVSPRELDAAEVHDCFSITELVAYEALGWAEPGRAAAVLESGPTTLPQARAEVGVGTRPEFTLPVNTGGGLIADCHPVGATGVRQVVEVFRQGCGEAGDRQVEAAKTLMTFNMGGSLTTNVAMISRAT